MAKKQSTPHATTSDANDAVPKDKFHLKVYAPFKVYYEGVVASISAENGTGPFDILANHHNFLTLLNPCELTIRTSTEDKEPEKIKITRGIMQVKANDVVVFLDV
ncbi:F0F1 ATP synthase subunit epsilon [Candidatus Nomurabacteria bacterium]|nr:F0F1 ATP synthase subunit epsilon [Candidatus Nomurabacteria bacterium]